MTGLAQRVRVKDPEWRVPVLWRSEMRSILAGYEMAVFRPSRMDGFLG